MMHAAKYKKRRAFTLLELLVAITLLSVVMSLAFQGFNRTLMGWKRGTQLIEDMRYGDHFIQEVSQALHAMLFFNDRNKSYAFRMENKTENGFPADYVSFVTTSTACGTTDLPWHTLPHRLQLFMGTDSQGDPALCSITLPPLADEEKYLELYQPEAHLISSAIVGLDITVWNEQDEVWEEEWKYANRIPARVKIELYISTEINEEPVIYRRVIDIPTAESVGSSISSPTTTYHHRLILPKPACFIPKLRSLC